MENSISDSTRKWLISLVNVMDEEIGLREEDKVLIILQLNTEDKVDQFNEWIKTKMVDEKFVATPVEVMNATARIGRLECND